jgi:hypothetical protein
MGWDAADWQQHTVGRVVVRSHGSVSIDIRVRVVRPRRLGSAVSPLLPSILPRGNQGIGPGIVAG